jgi:acetylornithine/succinyldiaminopimelate/putrescine aminotransferase
VGTRPDADRAAVRRSDRRLIGRAVGALDVVPVRTDGSRVFDADGRSFIDFYVGWCVGNLGWGEREVRARLRSYRGPDYVFPHFAYEPWTRLAKQLCALSPGMGRCFRTVGGTESVEVALQAAMIATGRHKVVSVEGAYHGNSMLALSVGGSENRKGFDRMFPGCRRIEPPLDEQALDRVDRLLKGGDVAAFIMEPVSCNLGPLIPERSFMTGLSRLCAEHGTMLVMDEVACGFGRTGRIFATEHFGIRPDIMCLAKGLTGGYAPMGATLMTTRLADEVAEGLDFYSTFGWHPLAVEAAQANVQYLRNNRAAILHNVKERGRQFQRRLREMDLRTQQEVTAIGLTIGLRLESAERVHALVEACRRDGLLLTEEDRTVQMFPALTIDEATVDEGLDILEKTARRA